MNNVKIITIDGPAASGKGTLARALAEHLGYFYLDTGAIYRLVALSLLDREISPEDDEDTAVMVADTLATSFTTDMMNNSKLRSDSVGQMASRVAALPKVRDALQNLQRTLANNPPNGGAGSVLDGRDCGTVICPDATNKFFITANTEVRARRRYEELMSRGIEADYRQVLAEMDQRDKRDREREASPLKPASDAIVIDTSDLDAAQALHTVLENLN